MRLVNYRPAGEVDAPTTFVGLVFDEALVDLDALLHWHSGANQPRYRTVDQILERGCTSVVAAAVEDFHKRADSAVAASVRRDWDEVALLPPVLRPSKVIGVGLNHDAFVTQIGEPRPVHPTLFHKTASALRGHRQSIIVPTNTNEPIPEGELAVVIGRRASRVSEIEAPDFIAGYCCANDISARDLEFQTSQWTAGKMLPTFAPLGPALVTPDEIADVGALEITTVLNGEVIQQGSTSGLIFGVYDLVSRISMLVDLEPGDVIMTGTCSDLGETDPPVNLASNDVVEVLIDGVGHLANPVIAPHLPPRRPDSSR